MRLNDVHIKGFRNFKDSLVVFAEKTLLIGPNDVGKTNLLHAIRLLLDRSLSDADITPQETDFYAYENTHEFFITIHFCDIQPGEDDCIISHFRGAIGDGNLYLQFHGVKNNANEIGYSIHAGKGLDNLIELQGRSYLKRLSFEYLSSYRDLRNYIRREQKNIIAESKKSRSAEQETADLRSQEELEGMLDNVTTKIRNMHFIKSATAAVNTELKKLSADNQYREILFDAGTADHEKFMNNLNLVSQKHGKQLTLGGDGRNNQIFLSVWTGSKGSTDTTKIIFGIEEPEAHLHPHQQRSLSNYLLSTAKGQLIITTHSPQIAAEFNPSNIVRLYESGKETLATGSAKTIADAAVAFAHRMNILPAEAFFADAVILVEGVSEVLFYKALSKALDKDLDAHNVSILAVDGVGFAPYVSLLRELQIPFCLRTDNDCLLNRNGRYRNAGIQRLISCVEFLGLCEPATFTALKQEFDQIYWQDSPAQTTEAKAFCAKHKAFFEGNGLYIADKNLEEDILDSALLNEVLRHCGVTTKAQALDEMSDSKGEWMFSFVISCSNNLSTLATSNLVKPIEFCISKASGANESDI